MLNAIFMGHVLDVALIDRGMGCPRRFIAHANMKAPGAAAHRGRGKQAPGGPPRPRGVPVKGRKNEGLSSHDYSALAPFAWL